MHLLLALLSQVDPPHDPGSLAAQLAQAFTDRKWTIFAGVLLALLIELADRIDVLQWVPAGAKGTLAVVIATLVAVAGGLALGQAPIVIAGTAISVAVAAIGSHELIIKRFDKQPEPTPPTT